MTITPFTFAMYMRKWNWVRLLWLILCWLIFIHWHITQYLSDRIWFIKYLIISVFSGFISIIQFFFVNILTHYIVSVYDYKKNHKNNLQNNAGCCLQIMTKFGYSGILAVYHDHIIFTMMLDQYFDIGEGGRILLRHLSFFPLFHTSIQMCLKHP